MLRRLRRLMLWIFAVLALLWIAVRLVVGQPVWGNARSALAADPAALQEHVRAISEQYSPRDYASTGNLDACAQYIIEQCKKTRAGLRVQQYEANGRTYRNIVARFGSGNDNLIVVGAHYDACGHTPGADDNASGVAGLLELARLLDQHPTGQNVELVAYTLEEPPYFRTAGMGSYQHAAALKESGATVRGVIVLEMIGHFSDQPGSQRYPLPILRAFYPGRGDYIAIAGRIDQWRFLREFKSGMKGATPLPVWSVSAPAALPGLDFSDHLNYWPHGWNALMVTDTAFYRNAEYHQAGDTWDTLDYRRMADVVVGVYEGIKRLK